MPNWIKFDERETQGKKTRAWIVRSVRRDSRLGEIRWYGSWRQYCFFPEARSVWSHDCLAQVQTFILEHKHDRKGPRDLLGVDLEGR